MFNELDLIRSTVDCKLVFTHENYVREAKLCNELTNQLSVNFDNDDHLYELTNQLPVNFDNDDHL